MTDSEKLLLAAVGSLVVGLSLYLVSQVRQRAAVETALLVEINMMLDQARDYLRYFEQTSHPWLKVGEAQPEAPVFSAGRATVLAGSIPQLHLMRNADIRRVLAFYGHFQDAEKLIEILFARIAVVVTAKTTLTAEAAALTDGRRKRIVHALQNLLGGCAAPVRSIANMPSGYAMPSTLQTARAFRRAAREAEATGAADTASGVAGATTPDPPDGA